MASFSSGCSESESGSELAATASYCPPQDQSTGEETSTESHWDRQKRPAAPLTSTGWDRGHRRPYTQATTPQAPYHTTLHTTTFTEEQPITEEFEHLLKLIARRMITLLRDTQYNEPANRKNGPQINEKLSRIREHPIYPHLRLLSLPPARQIPAKYQPNGPK